jgi:polynucleotide 5'-kinase involved in rRNA processing
VKEFLETISDESLSSDEKRELISELNREIMACGMIGHGKSTLLNGSSNQVIVRLLKQAKYVSTQNVLKIAR